MTCIVMSQPGSTPPNGDARLTPRELEALAWAAEGKSNAAIAVIIGCREATVVKHLQRVYKKIGVENRTSAANWLRDQEAARRP